MKNFLASAFLLALLPVQEPTQEKALAPAKLIVTEDGTVIEDQVLGPVVVRAKNVVLRRCKIDAGYAYYGIEARGPRLFLSIEACEVRNASHVGILCEWTQVLSTLIEHCQDGIFTDLGGHVRVAGCTLRNLGWDPLRGHADGIQIMGGGDIWIVGNTLTLPHTWNGKTGNVSNSCIYIESTWEPAPHRIFVLNNVLDGGLYTVWCLNGPGGMPQEVHVAGNTFLRYYFASKVISPPAAAELEDNDFSMAVRFRP